MFHVPKEMAVARYIGMKSMMINVTHHRPYIYWYTQSNHQIRTPLDYKFIFCPAKNAYNHRDKRGWDQPVTWNYALDWNENL